MPISGYDLQSQTSAHCTDAIPMKHLPPLNALRAFHVAAQESSFTKAGEALHVTQGAISRQVKLLEETLGQPLFFRVHQGIYLSEAGKKLSERLQSVFDTIRQAVDDISNDARRQQVRINIPPTFATRWLAPRLSQFCELYPFVDLRITTNWLQSTRNGEGHDCLVVFARAPWQGTDCEQIMLEKHVMVGNPRLWRNDLPPTLSNKTLLHILDGNERMPVWERWIETYKLNHIDPKPGLSFSTLDQVINATLSGTGIAIVDEVMVRPELAAGTLRRFNNLCMDGPFGYWFIDVARDGEHKAIVRLLREWLKQQIELDRLDDGLVEAASY